MRAVEEHPAATLALRFRVKAWGFRALGVSGVEIKDLGFRALGPRFE